MADSIDQSILEDFIKESLILVDESIELLESIENHPSEVEKLNDFANRIDRVMGGAKSLALMLPPDHSLNLIGDYCAICKSVGYQGAQIKNNEHLYSTVVALLIDAVEMTKVLLNNIQSSIAELKKNFTTTFLDRLKWISLQYDALAKQSSSKKMEQNEIDGLLKKLGL